MIEQAVTTQTEIVYENTIFAEPIFHIGGFSVTNSLLTSWIAVVIILIISFKIKNKVSLVPRGLQNAMEALIEFFLDLLLIIYF